MDLNEYFISVGEPWNFESQDGPNIIKGRIVKIVSDKCVLFQTNFNLDFNSLINNILVLTQRNEGIDFKNLDDDMISLNGAILFPEISTDSSETELRKNSKFILIGSLHKDNK